VDDSFVFITSLALLRHFCCSAKPSIPYKKGRFAALPTYRLPHLWAIPAKSPPLICTVSGFCVWLAVRLLGFGVGSFSAVLGRCVLLMLLVLTKGGPAFFGIADL
jgi:hypothetical protein